MKGVRFMFSAGVVKPQTSIVGYHEATIQEFLSGANIFIKGMEHWPEYTIWRYEGADSGGVGGSPVPVPHEQVPVMVPESRPFSIDHVTEQSIICWTIRSGKELFEAALI
jgi:hypothetical protein